jgi:hypothetical protein
MFDELQNRKPEPSWIGLKIIVGGAAATLLGFGLCGAGLALQQHTPVAALSVLGIGLLLLGCLGIVIGVVTLIIEALVSAMRRR